MRHHKSISAKAALLASLNMTWGADKQYAWTSGIEVPLASESLDFKIATGLVCYF